MLCSEDQSTESQRYRSGKSNGAGQLLASCQTSYEQMSTPTIQPNPELMTAINPNVFSWIWGIYTYFCLLLCGSGRKARHIGFCEKSIKVAISMNILRDQEGIS